MINNVVLVGRMTRDAELRLYSTNQAVATLPCCQSQLQKSKWRTRSRLYQCVMWRQQAENLCKLG